MAMTNLIISAIQAYPELLLSISCFLFFFLLAKTPRDASGRGLQSPAPWPIAGHTPQLFLHLHDFHDWLTHLLRDNGCTFLLHGPVGSLLDVVLTCDPANVNHVFNANFANYPKGVDFAEMFDFLGGGIFTSDKESWKYQRKKAHSFMASPKFRSYADEAIKAKVMKSLIPLLDDFSTAGNDRTLDLQDVFLRLTFDNTCMLVFGIDPGCLSAGFPTLPFAAALDAAEEAALFRQMVPVTWWKILRRLRIGPEKKMADAVSVMDHFIDDFISKRKQEKRGGADLLSSYLDSAPEIADNGFVDVHKFLRDTALNFMVAGRDTTSSALTWFFYLVAKNPNVEAKILDELKLHGSSELGKLVYLHAAFCESLRLYPPVPFEHKGVVEAETLPTGHEVHRNRRVLFSLYAMGRMEGIWGKDCMEFRPERWISEAGRIRHVPAYKFFAFNTGPRTCLGKEIAFAQMKAVAAAMMGRFRVRVLEGFVARPNLSIILHMEEGLKVRVSKREE